MLLAVGGLLGGQRDTLDPSTYRIDNVQVLGRSANGSYQAESNAVAVSWNINPSAPATIITGTPVTPTRSRNATLVVSQIPKIAVVATGDELVEVHQDAGDGGPGAGIGR